MTEAAGDASGARRARGVRSRGRVLALQIAYSWEQNRYQTDAVLVPDDGTEDGEARAFARELFDGLIAQRTPIDAAIDKRLENWTLARLAVIDRAILRLGALELLYRPDTPPKVAINEYIELAKEYGTEAKTTRLVNGVLDRIAREHRADEVGKGRSDVRRPTSDVNEG